MNIVKHHPITRRRDLTVVLVSWHNPKLVEACVTSLLESFTTDANVFVVLNGHDDESRTFLEMCDPDKVSYISLPENLSLMSLDFAIPFLNSEFIANTNDDVIFVKGWDAYLMKIIRANEPCIASASRVEPTRRYQSNDVVIDESLGSPEDPETKKAFLNNCLSGKYHVSASISYNHPMMVRMEDYIKVAGHSNDWDLEFFPCHGMDDYFAWRFWLMHKKCHFISSDKILAYHGGSLTMQRLKEQDEKTYDTSRTTELLRQRMNGKYIWDWNREIRLTEKIQLGPDGRRL